MWSKKRWFIAVLVIVLLMAMALPSTVVNAVRPVPGCNGDVKIHNDPGEPCPVNKDEPKVCKFHLHGFNFDSGASVTWRIETQPGDVVVIPNTTLTIGSDGTAKTGQLSLEPGQYKLYWHQEGCPGGDKHKVFKVKCEEPKPPYFGLFVECVQPQEVGYLARFGYKWDGKEPVTLAVSKFTGPSTDVQPPTTFEPGRHTFDVLVASNGNLVWTATLEGKTKTTTANQNYPKRCGTEPTPPTPDPTPGPTPTPKPKDPRRDLSVIVEGGWEGVEVQAWIDDADQGIKLTAMDQQVPPQPAVLWSYWTEEDLKARVKVYLPENLKPEEWEIWYWVDMSKGIYDVTDEAELILQEGTTVADFQFVSKVEPWYSLYKAAIAAYRFLMTGQ